MIPQKRVLEELGSLPGRETEFTIGDPRWVMDALARLYSNIEGAVVREYSTNARDSHIQAGKEDVPIQVRLPDAFSPYFEVEDFGVGMDVEDLEGTYTQFGVSTKRTDAQATGVYGFGSKSAIAYTNQFTVCATKDGITTDAIVTRRADWSIVMQIVNSRQTDKPNGVKVTVPVKNHAEFTRKAQDFYKYWAPGTVLVNGKEPERAVGEKINDGMYYSTIPGKSVVVMGSVPYPIANPDALFRNKRLNAISFVAYVEMGAVSHTPSREALDYDEETRKALQKLIDDFEGKIIGQAKKEIDDAPNHWAAYDKLKFWSNKLGQHNFTDASYKGDKFVGLINLKGTRYEIQNQYGYRSRYNTYTETSIRMDDIPKTLFVTNFTTEVNAGNKAKAREYSKLKGLGSRLVYFTAEKEVKSPWVDQARVVSWEDLKSSLPKKPRKPRLAPAQGGRIAGSWDYYTAQGIVREKEIPAKTYDDGLVFYCTTEDKKKYGEYFTELLKLVAKDGIIVMVGENRKGKFIRDYPKVMNFVHFAKSRVQLDGSKLVPDTAKEAIGIAQECASWLELLGKQSLSVHDPEVLRLAKLVEDKEGNLKPYRDAHRMAQMLGMGYSFKQYVNHYDSFGTQRRKTEWLFQEYPLLRKINRWSISHDSKDISDVIIYMNAVYAAKKGKP